MALSTVSSLDESFTTGVSLLHEDNIPTTDSKQNTTMDSSSPRPSAAGKPPVSNDQIPTGSEHGNDSEKASQPDPTETNQTTQADKVKVVSTETAQISHRQEPTEGDESDDGSEDDAILQVHD